MKKQSPSLSLLSSFLSSSSKLCILSSEGLALKACRYSRTSRTLSYWPLILDSLNYRSRNRPQYSLLGGTSYGWKNNNRQSLKSVVHMGSGLCSPARGEESWIGGSARFHSILHTYIFNTIPLFPSNSSSSIW